MSENASGRIVQTGELCNAQYTLSKIQIQELRDEYLARKPRATLRQFHDAFVAQGGMPIRDMRAILFR